MERSAPNYERTHYGIVLIGCANISSLRQVAALLDLTSSGDNGTEVISTAILRWQQEIGIAPELQRLTPNEFARRSATDHNQNELQFISEYLPGRQGHVGILFG